MRKSHGSGAENGERGGVLLEVVVTSAVLAIAVVGISFMFSLGNTWAAAGGDDRVALSLARQKIEQLRSMTFSCVPLGGPGAKAALSGCTATQNYSEGGATWVTATGATASAPSNRNFTRLTCVQYVSDTDFSSPAYAGDVTASPCDTGTPSSSKRITVIVRPSSSTEALPPVVLEAWITSVPGGM
jgi:type II secretory pathway pseudopilin PulG